MLQGVSDILVSGPAPGETGAQISAVPVHLVDEAGLVQALAAAGEGAARYALAADFRGKSGQAVLIQDGQGGVERVLFGLGPATASPAERAMAVRALPSKLPPADYVIAGFPEDVPPDEATLAFVLGSYGFEVYKRERAKPKPRLVVDAGVDLLEVARTANACALARDMVNAPANDMGPAQMETVVRELARAFGAEVDAPTGEELLERNYPAIHTVGRAAAADRAPRLIELTWTGPGGEDGPLIAVAGKGVAFDSGGLDIKPSAGMRLMKKDMGGAAHAIALGCMIMDAGLPVHLAVLVPAVENAISAAAMRPGDVISTRKGLSVEIGNTDAEGRLILADALARAAELKPDLTIDLATLTGAARVAVGPEIVPFYTDDEALAADLGEAARAAADPLWRMPLWAPYAAGLESDVADLKNDPESWVQAGSVAAALFLKRFAPETGSWAHFDIFAWNPRSRPGWPTGGEVQAIRAIFRVIQARYGARS